jgi:hypothetical protein
MQDFHNNGGNSKAARILKSDKRGFRRLKKKAKI